MIIRRKPLAVLLLLHALSHFCVPAGVHQCSALWPIEASLCVFHQPAPGDTPTPMDCINAITHVCVPAGVHRYAQVQLLNYGR